MSTLIYLIATAGGGSQVKLRIASYTCLLQLVNADD